MRDYPFSPVPFTDVHLEDSFWLPRLETNRTVTLPYVLERCRDDSRVDNFLKAAGDAPGPHEGREFNDSDVYKAIEGAAYSLRLKRDPDLEAQIDSLVEIIARAQEEDGYLYTARTIDPAAVDPELEGSERWSNLRRSHELYCLGHLYEAAVAYFQATGKRRLLDISLGSAELILKVFGPEGKRDVPGHQEIELGLVKLYRVTGDERYLGLAKFFLDERGRHEERPLYDDFGIAEYTQDHLPVAEQDEALGHAVRATYMYSAMADVAALADVDEYRAALEAIWQNVVGRKMYLTGGIGSQHEGEAFGANYELPNLTAYNETCAAIGNVMWNHRMFLLSGQGKYIDVLERSLYNNLLAGVALAGTEFFYPNPLESDGEYLFNMGEAATRCPWFDVSCCPGNLVRFFPSLPGYVYGQRNDTVYVNLFIQGRTSLRVDGRLLELEQRTHYPWDGTVEVTVQPEEPDDFTLALRIPGWARGEPVPSDLYEYEPLDLAEAELTVDGERVALEVVDGYAFLTRRWQGGERIRLTLPMAVRLVRSHPNVSENSGKLAVERGPLVYCAEGADNGGHVEDLRLSRRGDLRTEHSTDLLGGVTVVHAGDATLIPYYAWSHRGEGEMKVWLAAGEVDDAPAKEAEAAQPA